VTFEQDLEAQRQAARQNAATERQRAADGMAREDPPDPRLMGLTREQVLAAIQVSVMVVSPDQTLVVRIPPWLTPSQVQQYQRSVDELCTFHRIPNHILILPGSEFAVVSKEVPLASVEGSKGMLPFDLPQPPRDAFDGGEPLRYVEPREGATGHRDHLEIGGLITGAPEQDGRVRLPTGPQRTLGGG
jgi:hypothetical protein